MRIRFSAALAFGIVLVGFAADPRPAPPALNFSRPPVPEPEAKSAGPGPVEYSIGDPSPLEQVYLERVNRARAFPREEGFLLVTSTDPEIQSALRFFNVDLQRVVDEIALYPAQPPLSFEPRLIAAARGHTDYLFRQAVQEHEQRDPVTGAVVNSIDTRISAVGYPWNAVGENIFSYASSADQGHAGFEVDWGFGDGGVQRPPGHRDNNHSAAFREVGIGVLEGTNRRVTATATNIVGPQVVTIDFGRRSSATPLATGVVFYDVNTNATYDAGEGIPGVRIESAEAGAFAVTGRSGGFSVPAVVGSNGLRFLLGTETLSSRSFTAASDRNHKQDLVLPYAAPVLSGPTSVPVGATAVFLSTRLPGAEAHEWTQVRLEPYGFVDGAEGGATNMDVSVGPGWDPVRATGAAVGSRKYQLVHGTAEDQVLTIRTVLRPGPGSALRFRSMLGFSTTTQVATAEVSPAAGGPWVPVFTQRGWGNGGGSQTTYSNVVASLEAYAGTDIRVRFRYRVEPGSYFPQTTASFGWHLDEIRFDLTSNPVTSGPHPLGGDRTVVVQPGTAGTIELRVRPVMAGFRLPYSAPLRLVVGGAGTAGGEIVVDSIGRSAPDRLQLDFSLRSGLSGVWRLQGAPTPTGPWSVFPGATLTTNGPGRYRFSLSPGTSSGFLRVAVE
jgi:hypothetical protein